MIAGQAAGAFAQANGPDDWSRVRHLPPRTEIEIVVVSGPAPIHGFFLEADDSRVTVSDLAWEKIDAIARADVASITALTKPSTGAVARKGATAGLVAGLLTGAMTVMVNCKTHSCERIGLGVDLF